jgi:hypothetical protein
LEVKPEKYFAHAETKEVTLEAVINKKDLVLKDLAFKWFKYSLSTSQFEAVNGSCDFFVIN